MALACWARTMVSRTLKCRAPPTERRHQCPAVQCALQTLSPWRRAVVLPRWLVHGRQQVNIIWWSILFILASKRHLEFIPLALAMIIFVTIDTRLFLLHYCRIWVYCLHFAIIWKWSYLDTGSLIVVIGRGRGRGAWKPTASGDALIARPGEAPSPSRPLGFGFGRGTT